LGFFPIPEEIKIQRPKSQVKEFLLAYLFLILLRFIYIILLKQEELNEEKGLHTLMLIKLHDSKPKKTQR